eukprot:scaffold214419_cov18-Tisochrysis_lutea.AAC.1
MSTAAASIPSHAAVAIRTAAAHVAARPIPAAALTAATAAIEICGLWQHGGALTAPLAAAMHAAPGPRIPQPLIQADRGPNASHEARLVAAGEAAAGGCQGRPASCLPPRVPQHQQVPLLTSRRRLLLGVPPLPLKWGGTLGTENHAAWTGLRTRVRGVVRHVAESGCLHQHAFERAAQVEAPGAACHGTLLAELGLRLPNP